MASLLPGFYSPAYAATLCVNPGGTGGCESSIQDAVDAAAPGDIINVEAGTYNEQVTINKALTLNGPNAGTSGLAARAPEASVTSGDTTFDVTSADVTIDGFEIDGDFGIYVSGSSTNTLIQNNIISGTTRALSLDASGADASVLNNHLSSNIRSLHVSNGPYSNLRVNGNRFSGDADTGIQFSGTAQEINGFEFQNNEVLHTANIGMDITNAVVSGNIFAPGAVSVLGLQISLHDSTIVGNTFNGGVDNDACFQLFGSQFGLSPSNNVEISGNTFNDCGSAAAPWTFAIQLSPDIDDILIVDNTITNAYDGINTRTATAWAITGTIEITGNRITDSRNLGVNNTTTAGTLDAEYNWWGHASGPGPIGPGSGDGVSANVDYDPWWCAVDGSCVSSATTAPGDTVTTEGPEGQPTNSDTQTTSVATPAGGPVTIEETDTHTESLPGGYSFFGQQVNITANPSANPNPLVLTFKFDASTINPPAPNEVIVRRDGVEVPACNPLNGTNADPDPCVESQGTDGNGDLVIVVYTTQASPWDFIAPTPVVCTITGTPGDDYLVGTPGHDVICGLGGNDKIVGKGGGDELYGQDGNDTIYGNDGADDMYGGDGNDDFFGGPGGDDMYGSLGNDRMWGGLGNESMYGGFGDDLLVGRHGDDYLEGSNGNDTLLAGDGNNTVDGGAGDDLVHAGLGNDNITTDGGFDSVFAGDGTNSVDTGGGNDYVLTGTGPDFVTSGTGDDKVETGLGDDIVLTDGGADAVYLGDGANFVDSGAGDDYVLGGPGVDTIFTGDDNDRIDGEGGNNYIDSGNGIDAIFTGPGNNQIFSGSGADFVLAGLGADTIFAGGDNDVVFAGRGTNSINGEGGDDYLVGGEDNDAFDGGTGTDTCDAGSLGFDTQVNCEVLVGTFP